LTSPACGGGCAPRPTRPAGTLSAGPSPTYRSILLHLDGRSTRQLPYERRRELLLELGLDDRIRWRTPRHFVGESDRVLAATREYGLEGGVAKRLGSPYLRGARSDAWVKHKHTSWCTLGPDHIELELTRAIDAPNVTHLHYRVVR
jgi:ATP dependent DNA ligase domain